jgi:flavin-dependent dehydrogenase
LLASKGLDVLVLDKNDFPRDKLCAGLLTWKTVNFIESVFQISIDTLKSQEIVTFQCSDYGIGNRTQLMIKGKLAYPFHFVERRTYDSLWLKKAVQAGAEFRPNEKVVSLDHSGSKILTDRGCEFRSNFIFGADGAQSGTRRQLLKKGLIETGRQSDLATALEITIPKSHAGGLPDFPAIYFGYIPWGYAWCFPGKNRRILGICGLNGKSGKLLKYSFDEFLKSLGVFGKVMPASSSHALPFGNYLKNPGYANILLMGDACGLADPLLGEGIYYAHRSALLAAKAAMQSYHNPQAAIERYTIYLEKSVLVELRFARIIRQIFYFVPDCLRFKILAALFKTIPRKCEETVQGRRSFRWLRPLN